jgi:murein DD-endopeptidase MepM/ murein hydrolase activator NlpD
MRRLFALALVLVIALSVAWLVEPLAAPLLPPPEVAADIPGDIGGVEGPAAGDPSDDASAEPQGGPRTVPEVRDPLDDLLASVEGYEWPLPGAWITTYFAPASYGSMVLGGETIHNGLDMAVGCWTPIRAAHDGTVLYAGRRAERHLGFSSSPQPSYDELARRKLTSRALPIIVVVDDGNGLVSVYAHLARATVKRGQVVAAGQPIGFEGATGQATGCHLHYSVFIADGPWVPVAPTLVEQWRYPRWMRLRIDPLLVLPLDSPDAAVPVDGLAPPVHPPRYVAPPRAVSAPRWE